MEYLQNSKIKIINCSAENTDISFSFDQTYFDNPIMECHLKQRLQHRIVYQNLT